MTIKSVSLYILGLQNSTKNWCTNCQKSSYFLSAFCWQETSHFLYQLDRPEFKDDLPVIKGLLPSLKFFRQIIKIIFQKIWRKISIESMFFSAFWQMIWWLFIWGFDQILCSGPLGREKWNLWCKCQNSWCGLQTVFIAQIPSWWISFRITKKGSNLIHHPWFFALFNSGYLKVTNGWFFFCGVQVSGDYAKIGPWKCQCDS